MPIDLLSKDYYISNDNKKDMIYEESYDCGILSAYMIAKLKYKDARKFAYLSIDDMTLHFDISKDNKIHYLMYNTIENAPTYVKMKEYEEKDADGIERIKKCLDNNEPVLISTLHEMMRSNVHYDENYDINQLKRNERRHMFAILHVDSDYYYYMDDPFAQINPEQFDSVNGKRDVGRYPKDEMEKIFRIYLRCYEPQFDWTLDTLPYDRAKLAVEVSMQQYMRKTFLNQEGIYNMNGRDVIIKLMELAKEECIGFDSIVPNTKISFLNTLDWNCSVMYKMRIMLKDAIQYLDKQKLIERMPTQLISALCEAENNWRECRNILVKDSIRKKKVFHAGYYDMFKRILESEDLLIRQLGELKFKNKE